MSDETKNIITIICLILVYPIGVVLMLAWTKWPVWVKVLVCLPLVLLPVFIALLVGAVLVTVNPKAQIAKAKDVMYKNNALTIVNSIERYYAEKGEYPWGGDANNLYLKSDVGKESWFEPLMKEETLPNRLEQIKETKYAIFKKPGRESAVRVCFEPTSKGREKVVCVPEGGEISPEMLGE
jgi:hypothetical protein